MEANHLERVVEAVVNRAMVAVLNTNDNCPSADHRRLMRIKTMDAFQDMRRELHRSIRDELRTRSATPG